MCDDHAANGEPAGHQEAGHGSGVSRRNFIHGTAALAAAGTLIREMPRRLPLRSAARPVAADGTSAYSMAMHVHSSFSEQSGSMDAQLYQATANSVDVLWWTDHDARMDGIGYRQTVHFTSLTGESGGPGEGKAWIWKKAESGPLSSGSGGGIVTNPCSPTDPVAGGSMHLTAQTTSSGLAKFGYYANCHPGGWNYRDNLTGQSLIIDVQLTPGWTNGYLELLVATSYHEASAGRPAGLYNLSYQFVPSGTAGGVAQGNTGVITIPVAPGIGDAAWVTVTVTPSNDIAALWPDLDYRDFGLFGLTLSAASTGDLVDGHFDYLRFDRTISGEAFLDQQEDMGGRLAPMYPNVVQQQGLEVSWLLPHLNWFGPGVTLPQYGNTKPKGYRAFLQNTTVPQVHAAGGLMSYNHPFGSSTVPQLSRSQQDTLLAQVAALLLPSGLAPAALGCDLLEVGYQVRAGVDLAHHVALWDVMSRNAVFLTGNGTNDDHYGVNWHSGFNNWYSTAWAASTGQPDLLAAMAAGRLWCGSLSLFRGTLDLLVDGSCPMGSASVSSQTSRQLAVIATGLPKNGSVQVLQGAVDYAGSSGLSSNAQVIASYPATSFAGGSVTMPVSTSADSFVRTQVLTSSGQVVGLSNPVWLFQNTPPNGIPVPRQA
ncbi:MAG TPA: hypothetical protein VGL63_07665 [Streptosporangiaceae bacterium]|jgi:hypothetical protein